MLARHGRERVIAALARVSQTSPASIEEAVMEFERSNLNRRRKPQKSLQSILADLKISNKRTSDLLNEVASLLEAKILFPNRHEIIAFLRKHGIDKSRAKSRGDLLPQLLKVLSSLDETQLRDILDAASRAGESDYSLLANKIMGKPPDRIR